MKAITLLVMGLVILGVLSEIECSTCTKEVATKEYNNCLVSLAEKAKKSNEKAADVEKKCVKAVDKKCQGKAPAGVKEEQAKSNKNFEKVYSDAKTTKDNIGSKIKDGFAKLFEAVGSVGGGLGGKAKAKN